MESHSALRTTLTIVMNVLIAVAIVLTAGLVAQFFGGLASTSLGKMVIAVAEPLTIPFEIESIKTPYGGVFDVDAALTVALLIFADWVLSIMRGRA